MNPVAVGEGRRGDADPSRGHMGSEHRPSAREMDTHPPRRGDEDHSPTSPPPQTIGGLLAAAAAGTSAVSGRVHGDRALLRIRMEGKR
jgi:hypothetical protein